MNTGAAKWVLASDLFLAALTLSAPAGTLTVTNTSDHPVDACDAADCTLREAITAAQLGDVIEFAPSVTGTITLAGGQIPINKNLTITGPGARLLAISGNNNNPSRIFTINGGATVAISRVSLINGLHSTFGGQGGAIYVVGKLTLDACTLSSNAVRGMDRFVGQLVSAGTGEGGAIYVNDFATLVARNCTFNANTAEATVISGGAIWSAGNVVLVNSTISGNLLKPNSNLLGPNSESATGGGIFQKRGTLTIVNSSVCNNSYVAVHGTSNGVGGGIAKNDGTAVVQNTFIFNNSDPSNTSRNVAGAFTSRGFNLLENINGSTGWIASDKTNPTLTQLQMTGLQNNGGPTNTHAPLSGSYAIENGGDSLAMDPGPNLIAGDGDDVPLGTDQRGYPRLIGAHVDIGAVEIDVAQAAPNFFVTTTDEHDDGVCGIGDCSLREAVNASNANAGNNSVIGFIPAAYGTILNTLSASGLSITRPVTVNGPGTDLLAISGAGVNRVFNITSAGAVAINHLTVRDARSTTGDGGALRYNGSGTLAIHACKFFNNTTATNWSGGAIWTVGRVTITGSEFGGNKGGGGGAVYPRFGSVVTIDGCTFHNNEAMNTSGGGLGGAVLLWDGPTVGISNSVFTGNKAARFGGAIHVLFNSTLNVSNTTFSGNSLSANSGEGGAINNAGTMDLRDVTLTGNSVMGGGLGGALRNSGTSTLTGVTLNDNRVDAGGWGAGINNSATCTLTNVTLSGNTAPGVQAQYQGFGGGIYSSAGSLTLTNVTLSGNLSGTGITGGGGGIYVTGGSVSLTNTALDNGPSGENCLGFTGGTACLSDDGTCGFGNGRDNVDLRLRALANNGGATATHLPSLDPESPAIDGGTNAGAPTKDQRGIDRPQGGGFDVGAVEFAPSDIPPPIPTPTPTLTPTPVPGRLGNISTRLRVETGDNVLIGGFIVTGTQPKKVIIRAIGTSLPFADKLADPILELHGPNGLIESNDNWIDSPNKQEILDSTIPPSSDLESAIVQTLPANNAGYTAIVRGVNDGTGIGVVEAYDLDGTVDSDLANISTRGFVQTGDNVLIAGTIVVGQVSQRVIIRAIGPSLPIPGAMADPSLELRDSNGALLQENDNWVDSGDKQEIIDTTIPPTDDLESAIVATLPANNASYTAIVRGVNDTSGIAVVEIYALN